MLLGRRERYGRAIAEADVPPGGCDRRAERAPVTPRARPAADRLESRSMGKFAGALNEQIAYEFGASQQYVAIAVHYDAQTLRSSPRTSTGRRSRSGTTR